MGRKRKRAKAQPAATLAEDQREVLGRSTPVGLVAGVRSPTSTTPQRQLLEVPVKAAGGEEDTDEMSKQSREDLEDSDGLPGIPWALPPEHSDDEEEDDDRHGEEEEGEGSESSNAIAQGGSDSLQPVTILDPDNRWKQHPDRRRKLAGSSGGGGGGCGWSNNSSWNNDRGGMESGEKPGARDSRKAPAGRNGRPPHATKRGREETRTAETGLDDTDEDGGPADTDGYYGPRAQAPPPCTVFAPREGKVHRVGGGDPAAGDLPTALVVGLDPREQLCFVGAALVRCGRGLADLSGYTLHPASLGAYVEAHSPRWMGLLVVRALGVDDYSDKVARGGSNSGSNVRLDDADPAIAAEDDDTAENEIEEAIDRIGEDYPVVVVLRCLPRTGPLASLSAQSDADALYSFEGAAGELAVADENTTHHQRHQQASTVPRGWDVATEQGDETTEATAGSSREVSALAALGLAVELRLPGMQVVVSDVAGLRPFTVSQGWAEATDSVLAAPPLSAGGDTGAVLICGAKGVGKSTMCRFLINRLLGQHREVAYIDCDLGQPEFTAPGQVSLHLLRTPLIGPPHTNIRRPQLAYFIGTTTSKPEPLLYSAAVRALAEHAAARLHPPGSFFAAGAATPAPLVVNTDGWVKGMGEDLLGAVIDSVRPRHIVQILGDSVARTFELDLGRLPDGCQVHRVEAWSPPPGLAGGPANLPRPTPQDQRTLRLVAYFLRGLVPSGGAASPYSDGRSSDAAVVGTTAAEERRRGTISSRRRRGPAAGANYGGLAEESAGVAAGNRDGGGGSGSSGLQLGSASVRGGKLHDLEHEVAALLAAAKPRRLPWRAVQIRVMDGSVAPSLVLHAINGALVGLVAMPTQPSEGCGGGSRYRGAGSGGVGDGIGSSGGDAEPPQAAAAAAGEGLVCLAETPLAPCRGLGIVRSVDVEKRVLYVLTPEPPEALKDVNVLVMGSLKLPTVMLYDPNLCSHPYFSAEAVGGGVLKGRNNLLRRGGGKNG